jgi:hypothetical protein
MVSRRLIASATIAETLSGTITLNKPPNKPRAASLLVTPPGSAHASVVSARIPNFAYLLACTPIPVSPVVPVSAVPHLRLYHL